MYTWKRRDRKIARGKIVYSALYVICGERSAEEKFEDTALESVSFFEKKKRPEPSRTRAAAAAAAALRGLRFFLLLLLLYVMLNEIYKWKTTRQTAPAHSHITTTMAESKACALQQHSLVISQRLNYEKSFSRCASFLLARILMGYISGERYIAQDSRRQRRQVTTVRSLSPHSAYTHTQAVSSLSILTQIEQWVYSGERETGSRVSI